MAPVHRLSCRLVWPRGPWPRGGQQQVTVRTRFIRGVVLSARCERTFGGASGRRVPRNEGADPLVGWGGSGSCRGGQEHAWPLLIIIIRAEHNTPQVLAGFLFPAVVGDSLCRDDTYM